MQERFYQSHSREIHLPQQSVYEQIAFRAEQLVNAPSLKYQGPEFGHSAEEGFDCSGFVTHVLRETGVDLPYEIRHCNEYFDTFGVLIHPSLHRRGDLIFFSYDRGVSPTHMGIVIDQTRYIHAPGKDDTVVSIAMIEEKLINNPTEYQQYVINPIGFKRVMENTGRWKIPLSQQVFPSVS